MPSGAARPVVVGAGIGGLACAAALARRGLSPLVLERAPALAEVGAGIQVTPNGFRVLEALGVASRIEAGSIAAQAVEPMDARTGRRVARFDLRRAGPYRFLHRATLIEVLADAAASAGAEIRCGASVLGLDGEGVALADGSRLPASVVIGADGIRSAIRHGAGGGDATFTSQTAWRAIALAPHPPVARIWMAPGRHAVTYPLPGGGVNLVAVKEEDAWMPEGWHHPDDPANLRAAFADAAPELAAILGQVEVTHRWGLFRYPVAPSWQGDGWALLGDAAHPTLPFLAQGANLALEDAWVLARLVAEERLDRYEALRLSRVTRALAAADANARNYHLAGPARLAAHLGLSALGAVAPGAFLRRLDWLYGFDATAA